MTTGRITRSKRKMEPDDDNDGMYSVQYLIYMYMYMYTCFLRSTLSQLTLAKVVLFKKPRLIYGEFA